MDQITHSIERLIKTEKLIESNGYVPRPYQQPFWDAWYSGRYNRFVKVWHRRAGKDLSDFNLCIRLAATEVQTTTYVFPTLKMGREILWEGMTNDGKKFLDFIPREVIDGKPNDTRMTIKFVNGSIIRIGGSDSPDSLRGGNSKVFVLSEWAEQDPYTMAVIRPIVRGNKGKILFNFTPKGDNHAKNTFLMAQEMDGWWAEKLTVEDTGLFTQEELDQELQEYVRDFGEVEGRAKFEQEYYCSFDAPVVGSYYGEQMRKAEAEGRIGVVPYNAGHPVNTAWDLGVGDSTAIWFFQTVGQEVRLIDYYASSGVGLEHYANELKSKGYSYNKHFAPHDIEVKELGTGKSRLETAKNFGINFEVVANLGVDDGIQAARSLLPQCWFDSAKCEQGIMALKNYCKEYDPKNKVYRPYPKHDWASHPADAFRYLSVVIDKARPAKKKKKIIGYSGGDSITGYGRTPIWG
jgi:phage terminase large subunit